MIKLGTHGYVQYVESWGSDQRIIEAARMSTNKGFEGWEKDAKLLKYLWEHKHATPFEMAGLTLEIKAPIFIFREWHRHRTQSYNEMSARYVPLPNENFLPHIEEVVRRSKLGAASSNRQAQGTRECSYGEAEKWLEQVEEAFKVCEDAYQTGLSLGVPKELARITTTVARYSRMRASCNLRNWLGFLTLRMAPNAQQEIRDYANAVHAIVQECFPRTAAIFDGAANGR